MYELHRELIIKKQGKRYKYIITFEIQGRPQKWYRFGVNMESTLKLAKKDIFAEWPDVKPHKLLIVADLTGKKGE